MLFKPALLLALMVTLAAARPNPSSLKTIASATGSKSSIKTTNKKLAEKNSSPAVATIVEIPVQGSVQSISQTEALSATLQAQDSLQYSHNPVPTVNEKPVAVVEHQPPVPVVVAASNIAPETVNAPSSDAVATIVHTPVVAPVAPAAPVAPVVPVVAPVVVDQTPVVAEHKPTVVEPVVVEQPTPIVEQPVIVNEKPVEPVVPVVVVS